MCSKPWHPQNELADGELGIDGDLFVRSVCDMYNDTITMIKSTDSEVLGFHYDHFPAAELYNEVATYLNNVQGFELFL